MFNEKEFIQEFFDYYIIYDNNEYDLALIFDDFIHDRNNNYYDIVNHFIKNENELNNLLNEYKSFKIIFFNHNYIYLQLFEIIQNVFEDYYNDKN